jgi:site-specific recombinase XerD
MKLRQKCRPAALLEDRYKMQVLDTLLFSNTMGHYLTSVQSENKSDRTVEIYSYNLNLFLKHTGDLKIRDINVLHVREFMASRKKTVNPSTQHQGFRVLRTFFNWCIEEGFLEISPMKNINAPELHSREIQTYTKAEIQSMMNLCRKTDLRGARNRAMIAVLIDTGIRESEIVDLKVNMVNFKDGAIRVIGKKNKERTVHISSKAQKELWKYTLLRDIRGRSRETLFLSEEMNPLTPDGFRAIIRKIGLAAGVPRPGVHKFRHTFAIEYLRNGGDIVTLKYLMGHTNIATTMKYLTALNADDAGRAHSKFSPGDRFL